MSSLSDFSYGDRRSPVENAIERIGTALSRCVWFIVLVVILWLLYLHANGTFMREVENERNIERANRGVIFDYGGIKGPEIVEGPGNQTIF